MWLRNLAGGRIGTADELVYTTDEGVYYRKRCVFFLAAKRGEVDGGEPDHDLLWLTPEAAVMQLRHGSQRWAVREACRPTTSF